MKRALWVVFGVTLVASAAFAQGGQAPAPAPVSLAAGLQRAYATIKTNLTQASEQMADADYGFKAAPEIRTFGGQLGHVANFHYMLCAAAKGVPNPNMGHNLEMEPKSKAEYVKALADSFTFCDDAFSALTDASATELVTQGRGQVARGAVLSNLVAHDNEEYGITTVYMRLRTMVPPSTANSPMRGGAGRGAGGPGRGGF